MLREVRRQSRPRRWPWQPKTLRNLADEQSKELVELAAERSALLAAAVAKERERLTQLVQHQLRPRRWPWQPKTLRDRAEEQRLRFVELAAQQSTALATLAAARRDKLLGKIKQQSRPRRWPWQPKTLRDRAEAARGTLREASDGALEQIAGVASASGQWSQEAVAGVPAALRATAAVASDTVKETAHTIGKQVSKTASSVPDALWATAAAASDTVKETAHTMGKQVSKTTSVVPDALRATAAAASDTVKETAHAIGKQVGDATEATGAALHTAAQVPGDMIHSRVQAGKRKVRRGVRLVKTSFWSFIMGMIAGVLVAPRSGEETRKAIQTTATHIHDILLPPDVPLRHG